MISEIEDSGGGGSDAQLQPGFGLSRRWRFTLVELIVVAVIIVLVLCLLVPVIQAGREAQRRSACLHNAHRIALALQYYASTYSNAFPPSATIYGSGNPKTVGGYSFLVKLLPYMDMDKAGLYKTLYSSAIHDGDISAIAKSDGDIDAIAKSNAELTKAMSASVPEFVCPSNSNSTFQDPAGSPPHSAFTNYKAVGATTRDSLLVAADYSRKPPYGTVSMHPDGMIYPAANNLPLAGLTDGRSHTILLMETIDDRHSRWTVGAECTLVGLPQASGNATIIPPNNFYSPPEFGGTFGDDSGVTRAGLRTFLMYDFSPHGTDAGKYEDPDWYHGPPAYGPSSMHPGVVTVGMCDGSAMALSKRCDAANLFFLITKNNQDPFNLP
jgi:type II secretory pathway pseudopilin PulG